METNHNLLTIQNLAVQFYTYKSIVHAIGGLNLQIQKGETFGLVGESGCGKSVTAMSILRLIPIPPGKISSGRIWFEGEDLLTKSEDEMRRIRGKTISMIFQDPMTSLNPVFSVGDQMKPLFEYIRTSSGPRPLPGPLKCSPRWGCRIPPRF